MIVIPAQRMMTNYNMTIRTGTIIVNIVIIAWLLLSYIYGGHFLYSINWDERCKWNEDEYLACHNGSGIVREKGLLYVVQAGKFVLSPLWAPIRVVGSIVTNDSNVKVRVSG